MPPAYATDSAGARGGARRYAACMQGSMWAEFTRAVVHVEFADRVALLAGHR